MVEVSRNKKSLTWIITKTDAERNLPLFKRQGYHFLLYYEADRREMQVYKFHRD